MQAHHCHVPHLLFQLCAPTTFKLSQLCSEQVGGCITLCVYIFLCKSQVHLPALTYFSHLVISCWEHLMYRDIIHTYTANTPNIYIFIYMSWKTRLSVLDPHVWLIEVQGNLLGPLDRALTLQTTLLLASDSTPCLCTARG